MIIKYSDLCALDCSLRDIIVYSGIFPVNHTVNYEQTARKKHLLYYQVDGSREYYHNGEKILTLKKRDLIALPDGTHYLSYSNVDHSPGIGVSFELTLPSGEYIYFDEPIKTVFHDNDGSLYNIFRQLHFDMLHLPSTMFRLRGGLYSLLDRVFAGTFDYSEAYMRCKDIIDAIRSIENHPERNLSNTELAAMCYMSESSFMRKFKCYSGGITPAQYRNQIRMMRAEEYVNSDLSLDAIAESLGYYDASHLCRAYKAYTGHSLRSSLHS